MRIALIAPLYETVPPTGYGGTERVISGLADELVRLGHDVTLFCAGGSRTRAHVVAVVPAPLRTRMTLCELHEVAPHLHLRMLAEVYRRSADFDIIHSHTDIWTLPFVGFAEVPTLVTMHGRLDLDALHHVVPIYPDVPFVSISDAQRVALDHLPVRWVGTCYNGLALDGYRSTPRGAGDYLAFVGRITPEKRPDWAVEVASRVGLPLRVAAKVDPVDTVYWESTVRPLFERHDVDFVGELDDERKAEFLAGAKAMLFPIDWPEPFGLVMIESMAAGTPVVALRRGSVPEIIEEGVSGLVCDSLDEMVRAIEHVDLIDPEACRRRASHFSVERMTREYLAVYRRVIEERRQAKLRTIEVVNGARPRSA